MNWAYLQQTGLGVMLLYGCPTVVVLLIGLGMAGWEERQKRRGERRRKAAELAARQMHPTSVYRMRASLFDEAVDRLSDFGTDELTAIVRAVHDPASEKPDDWEQWQRELKAK